MSSLGVASNENEVKLGAERREDTVELEWDEYGNEK
jgi:hypothetical protein